MDSTSMAVGFLAGFFAGGLTWIAVREILGLVSDSMTVGTYSDLTEAALMVDAEQTGENWDWILDDTEWRQ